jgi:hypothetical protein
MSLFREARQKALVHVRIHRIFKFWIWDVWYEGVPLIFDRSGITMNRKKAFDKAGNAAARIVRYENEGAADG